MIPKDPKVIPSAPKEPPCTLGIVFPLQREHHSQMLHVFLNWCQKVPQSIPQTTPWTLKVNPKTTHGVLNGNPELPKEHPRDPRIAQ